MASRAIDPQSIKLIWKLNLETLAFSQAVQKWLYFSEQMAGERAENILTSVSQVDLYLGSRWFKLLRTKVCRRILLDAIRPLGFGLLQIPLLELSEIWFRVDRKIHMH
ncbi:hypothetical protein MPTK1_7g06050 [Marchantia polymorpha subsp. ruderalis]|uniref:Uncharacterized protein n=2 Tax=Marchantia polymorpha TaxID=3197 RepID=A0AAF6BWM7_MARPO|nr:hypothetical protein MARPO_0057s0066 [Marchantia polymorpha]BBN16411.1 hypothetical protein Mp_7g06050 [Marchantia polymorpha subsp. ruderalis]|eukprot:PTQ37431.1 hypothetical protein MARPO_0057s0066 [Marchantia polymorpha]